MCMKLQKKIFLSFKGKNDYRSRVKMAHSYLGAEDARRMRRVASQT